jgi:hypothetical protein
LLTDFFDQSRILLAPNFYIGVCPAYKTRTLFQTYS